MEKDKIECPKCKSKNVVVLKITKTFDGDVRNVRCLDCDCLFPISNS